MHQAECSVQIFHSFLRFSFIITGYEENILLIFEVVFNNGREYNSIIITNITVWWHLITWLCCPVENSTVSRADVGFFTILRVYMLAVVEQTSQQYLSTMVVKCYGGENGVAWKHVSKLLMRFWKKGEWSSWTHHWKDRISGVTWRVNRAVLGK